MEVSEAPFHLSSFLSVCQKAKNLAAEERFGLLSVMPLSMQVGGLG